MGSDYVEKRSKMTYWDTGKTMVLRGIDERAINGGTWNERKLGYFGLMA